MRGITAYMFTLACGTGATATTSNVLVQVLVPQIQTSAGPMDLMFLLLLAGRVVLARFGAETKK